MTNRFAGLSLDDEEDNEHIEIVDSEQSRKMTIENVWSWRHLRDSSQRKTVPRGLINHANFCYLNAVLQPLLLSQPFVNVIVLFARKVCPEQHKWLSAFIHLVDEFTVSPGGESGLEKRRHAVDPVYLYKCWNHSQDQEDAEEFLRLVLNGLHEELLKYRDDLGWPFPDIATHPMRTMIDEEWTSIGPKQRKASSRNLIEPDSPISCIFNGRFKSVLKGGGEKESHVLEPFQFLSVDIEGKETTSLIDAITELAIPEQLGKRTRTLTIDKLPPLLVIQLKRFIFDPKTFGISKSFKHIDVPKVLDLSKQVKNWSDDVFFTKDDAPIFRLHAIVYHMGRYTSGGHYTCHVWQDGDGWYYCDDALISRASEEVVGLTEKNKAPYLLFYERLDPSAFRERDVLMSSAHSTPTRHALMQKSVSQASPKNKSPIKESKNRGLLRSKSYTQLGPRSRVK